MERLEQGAEAAAARLLDQHPTARSAIRQFALDLQQHGILHAYADLMGRANHLPNPDARAARTALRDGLAEWLSEHQAPGADPRTVLDWLIHDTTAEQHTELRAQLIPVLTRAADLASERSANPQE
jgi:hypothetical protein